MTRAEVVQALTLLGLGPESDVLVHSSLSSIGFVEGGPLGLVEALVEAVSPGGTVLFPTLTGSRDDSVARPPVADLRRAPAHWVGKVPAAADRHPAAVRSWHPTHSVTAIGARAWAYTEGHERCETPCGVGSPYHRLALLGGFVLLLGCDHESNTSLHMVEELGSAPYHLFEEVADGVVIDYAGVSHIVPTPIHRWGVPRAFGRMEGVLGDAQRRGFVGEAECRLIDAEAQLRLGVELLGRDPLALVASAD